MGSQSKINLAYIAGFLDGDGSLMLQIKKRTDRKNQVRFMATICFYQDTRHEAPLYWIRDVLGIVYISRRNDGMSELRVNGYQRVKTILKALLPYIKFKKKQGVSLLKAVEVLSKKKPKAFSRQDLDNLIGYILELQNENYVTRKKKTKRELLKVLNLTP